MQWLGILFEVLVNLCKETFQNFLSTKGEIISSCFRRAPSFISNKVSKMQCLSKLFQVLIKFVRKTILKQFFLKSTTKGAIFLEVYVLIFYELKLVKKVVLKQIF